MLSGRSVISFIVTLWRDGDARDSDPEAWRGSVRPVLPRSEDEPKPAAIPFTGLSAVSGAVQRGLARILGSER